MIDRQIDTQTDRQVDRQADREIKVFVHGSELITPLALAMLECLKAQKQASGNRISL